jgi:argininosuccinate lyase
MVTNRFTCILTLAALLALPLAGQGDDVDAYPILVQLNQAQLVMLAETGLLPRPLAREMARGIQRVVDAASKPGVKRSGDYLAFEKQLVGIMGPDASKLHMGRSRIDMGATTERMVLRDEALAAFEEMAAARQRLLELAAKNVETIIPGYTHAVQAQPTSLGHYLSAQAGALERDADRLRSAYDRVNQSPLGSAAFGTSGFPLKRERLAELLGFPSLIENSYDATGLGTVDSKAEVASVLAISALTLGRFAQDLVIQYSDPSPGLMLADKLTGHSSIMPQKRNPGVIERLRYTSSSVVGDAQSVWMVSHNTPVGDVGDVRANLLNRAVLVTTGARKMYTALREIAGGLVVRPERTLAEVDADYSTMTELADTLLREAAVPFRVGHDFASALTTYGRTNGKRPKDLTYGEATEIYQKVTGQKLPLTDVQFRQAIDARHMVFNRKGRGGPQPSEVRRLLSAQQRRVAQDQSWAQAEKGRLAAAYATLDREFKALSEQNR